MLCADRDCYIYAATEFSLYPALVNILCPHAPALNLGCSAGELQSGTEVARQRYGAKDLFA